MIARPFPLGFRGFDTTTPLDVALCKAARAAGLDFAMRYGRSVTPAEIDAAMSSGLWLGFLTYGRQSDFSTATGVEDARALLDQVHGVLGVPSGITLGLDLETPRGATLDELRAYEAGFAQTVVPVNSSGVYVGAGLGMTSRELYALASTRYYKAGSRIVDAAGNAAEPACGWCLMQGYPLDQSFAGTRIDYDFAQHDFRGRQWWGVAPA